MKLPSASSISLWCLITFTLTIAAPALRSAEPATLAPKCWRSEDLGATRTKLGQAATHIGGNPPALVQLHDGRLAVTYGHRHQPPGMRARLSSDEGRTWGPEISVRDGAFDGDMGYPRSIVRPDGKVMTVYYFNGPRDEDRAIEGTLWTPPLPAPARKTASGPLAPVLQSLVDKGIVAGAVAFVADKDKVLDLEAAGYSRLATKEPMREDAMFWIASMSKSITATALMMLVDEGKLSLDDPVEKYLPEFKGQQVAANGIEMHPPQHPITVREIMSHTSGLVLASDKELKHTLSLEGDVVEYAGKPLRQEPGTKYEYNNCGINTGGRIIEVVSGQAYADFMQKRLFDPLKMTDTTFWPNEEQAQRLAHSARFNADKTGLEEVHLDRDLPPGVVTRLSEGVTVPPAIIAEMGVGMASQYAKHYGEPAGGFFSTARDVGALCQMLLNGGVHDGKRYLSERAIQQMSSIQTGDVPVSPQEAYGIGWSVKLKDDEGPSAGSYGHRGARRTAMWIDLKHGLAMVLLVERFDMTGDEQKVMYGSFLKAAIEKYRKAQ